MQRPNTDQALSIGKPVEDITCDLCIIGAGSGGLSVAAAAAGFGQSVVLIEKHKMGGDCLNYGCVPSKALIAAGKRAHAMRTASPFGIANVEPMVDRAAVRGAQAEQAGLSFARIESLNTSPSFVHALAAVARAGFAQARAASVGKPATAANEPRNRG